MEINNTSDLDSRTANASVAGGIVSGILGTIMNIWSNIQNQRNYKKMVEYNSPEKQVERLQAAGLNPNLALGMSNTVSNQAPMVTNPAESLVDLPNNISKMYNTFDTIQNRKVTNQIRKDNLMLQQIKVDIQKKIATQALAKGDLDLAMKAVNYDILSQTAPSEVQKAFADAGILSNKKSMSDIDLSTYEQYRNDIVQGAFLKNEKSKAETHYLTTIKPALEWYRANTARLSAQWSHEDRQNLQNIQMEIAKMNDAQRTKEYNLAVDKYHLAVRQQDWHEAHFWAEVAASAIGSGIKTLGRMYGVPIQ